MNNIGCDSHFEKVTGCFYCQRNSETQKSTADWCFETFPQYRGKQAISVLEEAVELAHACGCSPEEIHQTFTVAFNKLDLTSASPTSEIHSEAGDVLICLHALAEEYQFDLQRAEDLKMEANRKKTPFVHNSKVRAIR
jgi:hypothetical protein